jgi:SAM-dependent methyltransferase
MIVDRSGDRALFDASRTVRYFQPKQPGATAWRDILNDKESTKSRFRQLLDEMLERLPAGAAREVSSIERDGVLLVLHPVRQYERRNLKFMKGDLLSPGLPKADIVRCFNVLVYFDQSSRHQVFRNVNDVLPEGGILIAGTDWAETMLARYSVYRKEAGKFAAREFAFTLDNLRANLNYFAIHDDDTETCRLVRAVAALRSDQNFFKEFSARHDALHLDYEVCPRGADGYLGDLPDVSGEELARRSLAILRALEEEGYVERATEALRKAGFEAWRNEVGHVAIAPGGELA